MSPLTLLVTAGILLLCILGTRISSRSGIPVLLVFILLGMIIGSNVLLKLDYSDLPTADAVCTVALVFIMFYGGFGTKWETARPVAVKAVLLSSLGTVGTCFLTGLFCHCALGFPLLQALLMGSVISSTDAASVFSILRSKRLALKHNTSPLLELESGSNDPFAYMTTMILLTLMSGTAKVTAVSVLIDIFFQLFFGIMVGLIFGIFALKVLHYAKLENSLNSIFLVAVSLGAYALSGVIGGNGYLSTYLAGIITGNAAIKNKKAMVSFFDVFNSIMQMLIFFLLGMVATPGSIVRTFPIAMSIFLFMTIIARPVVCYLILRPWGAPVNQIGIIAWAGLRGASGIVFAIIAAVTLGDVGTVILDTTFLIVIISILCQGTLLPAMARWMRMIEPGGDVMKTFSDYTESDLVQFVNIELMHGHPWNGKMIKDAEVPPGMLIAAIERNGHTVLPKGTTVLHPKDVLTLGLKHNDSEPEGKFDEITITRNHPWQKKALKDINTENLLILLVTRDGEDFMPDGNTILQRGDTLITISAEKDA